MTSPFYVSFSEPFSSRLIITSSGSTSKGSLLPNIFNTFLPKLDLNRVTCTSKRGCRRLITRHPCKISWLWRFWLKGMCETRVEFRQRSSLKIHRWSARCLWWRNRARCSYRISLGQRLSVWMLRNTLRIGKPRSWKKICSSSFLRRCRSMGNDGRNARRRCCIHSSGRSSEDDRWSKCYRVWPLSYESWWG